VHYPEPYCQNLKLDFAHLLNIHPDNLLFGNGSIELIYLLLFALKAKRVGIPIPSFSEYEYASKNIGAECLFIKTKDDLKIKVDNLIEYLPKIDILFLANPNNPTGQIFSKKELLYLLSEVRRFKVLLIMDEVFIDFIKDNSSVSLIKNAIHSEWLIVLRSLTKFFAIAGLRLGYIVAYKGLIKKINQFQYPWAVNTLAQLAAKTLIKDTGYINKSRQFVLKEKDFLFNKLVKINCLSVYPPSANFILCKIERGKYNARKLAKVLAMQGILIRDCSNFRGLNDRYFRVAVRTRRENLKLISTLKEILQ
jgi:threonine-phosphate decarboxylase